MEYSNRTCIFEEVDNQFAQRYLISAVRDWDKLKTNHIDIEFGKRYGLSFSRPLKHINKKRQYCDSLTSREIDKLKKRDSLDLALLRCPSSILRPIQLIG